MYVVLTLFRSSTKEDWYFDSGSSKHMAGEMSYKTDLKTIGLGQVTFGDGVIRTIVGKGRLNYLGLLALEDVILVEGLIANLINISQLCDQGLIINFTRDQCRVTNNVKTFIMTGKRSSDNCHLWSPLYTNQVCHISKQDETSLWHKQQGHVSLKSI